MFKVFYLLISAYNPSGMIRRFNETITEGVELRLNCSDRTITHFDGGNNLFWTFQNSQQSIKHVVLVIKQDSSVVAQWDSEYEGRCSISTEDGSLTISNVSSCDMGTFTCSVRQQPFNVDVSWSIHVYGIYHNQICVLFHFLVHPPNLFFE